MSSNNAFAALYKDAPDYMIENEADELGIEHGGTRDGMIAALVEAQAEAGEHTRYTEITPADVAIKRAFDATAADFVPAQPVLAAPVAAPTPPETTPATPEPASPVAVPATSTGKLATHKETLLVIFTDPRNVPRNAPGDAPCNMSWADETEEELQASATAAAAEAAAEIQAKAVADAHARAAQEKNAEAKAAAEAQAQAEAEAEQKEAAEDWAKVKKSKRRSQRKKQVAVTETGSHKIKPTKPAEPVQVKKAEVPIPVIKAIREPKKQVEAAEGVRPVQEEEHVVHAAPEDIECAQEQEEPAAEPTVVIQTDITRQSFTVNAAEFDLELVADTFLDEQALATAAEKEDTVSQAELPVSEAVSESAEALVVPAVQRIDESAVEPTAEVKEPAATDAASTPPKKTKSSCRRKQKKAAKKAAAATVATVSSLPSSKTVDKTLDGGVDASEALQEPASPVKEAGVALATSPTYTAIVAENPPAASSELAAEEVKPAATTAASDSWDDWIDNVPTIDGRSREFELEEEAQAQYAVSLLPADDIDVTATELHRRHEEAEQARHSAVPASTTYAQAVVNEAPVTEDLHELEIEIDEVESPAAPTSVPADEPEVAVAAEPEDLPAPTPDPKQDVPVRSQGQRSIIDFFEKDPVVTVREVPSSSTAERVSSPAEPAEAITVEASESGDSSEMIQEEAIDSTNVADYLGHQPDADDEDSLSDGVSAIIEDVEYLPAVSGPTAGKFEGDEVAPEPAAATSSTQHIDAEEAVNAVSVIRQDGTPASGTDNAREPVTARQKKKRSRTQRNAAKKCAAAATAAAVPTNVVKEEEEPTTNADPSIATAVAVVSKPATSGRANRVAKRTTANFSVSNQDEQQITVALAQDTVIKAEVQDSKTLRQKADALLVAIPGTISDKVTSWVENADRKQKAASKTQNVPEVLSPDQLIMAYDTNLAQTGDQTSNKGRKKYMRKEVAQRLQEIRRQRQPGLSATTRSRIAEQNEERVVVGSTVENKAKAESKPVTWGMAVFGLLALISLFLVWLAEIVG